MYFYVQTPSAVFPLMEVKLSLQQRTCESFKERAAQSSAKQYTNSRRFKMHIWVHFWVHFDKNSTKDLTKDRKILESSAWFLWPFDPQAEALKQVEECLAVDPLILSSSSTKPAVEIQMFTQFSMFSHAISIILDLSHVRNCSVLVRRLFLVRHEPPQCPTGNLNRNVAKHCIAGMSWDMSWHMSWHML